MNPNGLDREAVAVFRRRRFTVAHRRRRLWARLLLPLCKAMLIVAIPATATAWVATSPALRVGSVTVSAGPRLSEEWAQQRLATLAGEHILLLKLQDVERELAGEPWYRGVQMSKKLPSRVEIRILERSAVALLRESEGLFYLDSAGRVIAEYEPLDGEEDFVVVSAGRENVVAVRAGLQAVEVWSRFAGPWAANLSEIESVDALSLRLHVEDLGFPLLVSVDRLEEGVFAFRRRLPKIVRFYPELEMADLRFSGQIVFQPAAKPQREG